MTKNKQKGWPEEWPDSTRKFLWHMNVENAGRIMSEELYTITKRRKKGMVKNITKTYECINGCGKEGKIWVNRAGPVCVDCYNENKVGYEEPKVNIKLLPGIHPNEGI